MVAFVAYMWTQSLNVLGMVYRNPRFIEGLVCIANRNPRFIEGQVCAAKMDQWRDYEVAYMSRDT